MATAAGAKRSRYAREARRPNADAAFLEQRHRFGGDRPMIGHADAEALRDLLRSVSPVAAGRAELPAELPLGAGGLGLDSIAVVELLLACELRFGVPASASLLAGAPVTVGGLLAHLRAAAPR